MKRMIFALILFSIPLLAQSLGKYLSNDEVPRSFKERYFSKGEHDFFPLHVGDLWQYMYYDIDSDTLKYFEHKIVKDTLVNNIRYFEMQAPYPYYSYYYRTDEEGVIRELDINDYDNDGITSEELLVDSLEVPYGTTYNGRTVLDTLWYLIDNDTLFTRLVVSLGEELLYTDKIGVTEIWPEQSPGCILTGAIINGVTHGTIVDVGDERDEIKPQDFELSQNYPNPFNPTTTISYAIPNVGDANFASPTTVKLVVYDALGREVATLVNAKQTSGKYSVQFNARELPSGVYFYTLRADDFVQTKKMILMK